MKLWHWAILAAVFFGACVLFDRVATRPSREADYLYFPFLPVSTSDSTYTVAWVQQAPDGMRTMEAHVVHGGRDSTYRSGILWSVGAVTRSTPTRDGGMRMDTNVRYYESPDPLTPAQVDRLARIWEAKQ